MSYTVPPIPVNQRIINILKDSIVNPFIPIPMSLEIFTINNKIFGTRGNFSCLVGKPKSKKTFLLCLLESICIKEGYNQKLIKSFIKKTTILHFDLEQSINHIHKYSKRIHKLTGNNQLIPNLNIHSLREYDFETRIRVIESAIYSIENVSLVVIDGIADLVSSYNDEEQASVIINKLMKWSREKNIHILIVIHSTKSSIEPKGHLGSQILQKAETVLLVEDDKNNNVTTVTSYVTRNQQIPSFRFTVDSNGLPQLIT
jgi:RecA-family ATPase